MLWATGSSLLILLAIVYLPFLEPVFHTVPLSLQEWGLILPLTLLPAIGAEVTKAVLRRQDAHRKAVAEIVPAPCAEGSSEIEGGA